MSSLAKTYITPEEYLAAERQTPYKSEYRQGEVFAMSGASRAHVLISGNVFGNLWQSLRDRPCEVYMADMRVSSKNQYVYPDVIVVRGEPRFADDQKDTLLNPTLLVEVLSPSTQDYDRSTKFESYRTLSSLQEYLLIAQDRPHVEHFSRQSEGDWVLSNKNSLTDTVLLSSLECTLPLAEIYRQVSLPSLTELPG